MPCGGGIFAYGGPEIDLKVAKAEVLAVLQVDSHDGLGLSVIIAGGRGNYMVGGDATLPLLPLANPHFAPIGFVETPSIASEVNKVNGKIVHAGALIVPEPGNTSVGAYAGGKLFGGGGYLTTPRGYSGRGGC